MDIDAGKTSELLGFNRNTINSYFMMFRIAIYKNQVEEFQKLGGTIEVDESYFGASRKRGFHGKLKRGRGTQKQPVFGIVQRQDEKGVKRVFSEIVPNCAKDTLLPIIKSRTDIKSVVINADKWKSYDALAACGYELYRVNHGKNEFAYKGDNGALITVNGIESFWSFTKRRLSKFNGYMTNLDLHLKECQWRWNHSPPERSQSKKDTKSYLFDLEQDLWYIVERYILYLRQSSITSITSNSKVTKTNQKTT